MIFAQKKKKNKWTLDGKKKASPKMLIKKEEILSHVVLVKSHLLHKKKIQCCTLLSTNISSSTSKNHEGKERESEKNQSISHKKFYHRSFFLFFSFFSFFPFLLLEKAKAKKKNLDCHDNSSYNFHESVACSQTIQFWVFSLFQEKQKKKIRILVKKIFSSFFRSPLIRQRCCERW